MNLAPLLEVERSVQRRAKSDELDVATGEGHERLRELIDDEIRRWDDEFRRGRRSNPIVDP